MTASDDDPARQLSNHLQTLTTEFKAAGKQAATIVTVTKAAKQAKSDLVNLQKTATTQVKQIEDRLAKADWHISDSVEQAIRPHIRELKSVREDVKEQHVEMRRALRQDREESVRQVKEVQKSVTSQADAMARIESTLTQEVTQLSQHLADTTERQADDQASAMQAQATLSNQVQELEAKLGALRGRMSAARTTNWLLFIAVLTLGAYLARPYLPL